MDLVSNIGKYVYVEVNRCINLPGNTLSSGGYIYPILGIHYFFTHAELWPFYISICIPQLIITLAIYLISYFVIFPILALVYIILYGPFGVFLALWSNLQQASMIAVFVVSYILMPEIQRIAFDSVLSREYADDVVLAGKLRRIAKVPLYIKCGEIFWVIPELLALPYSIAKALLMVLINLIPVVGPWITIIIQAPSKGLQSHARYFTLKGYDDRQVLAIYKANTGAYLGYGILSNSLELIPFFSVFFMFTNTLGAAIWAVKIEKEHKFKGIDTLKFLDLSTNVGPSGTNQNHTQEKL